MHSAICTLGVEFQECNALEFQKRALIYAVQSFIRYFRIDSWQNSLPRWKAWHPFSVPFFLGMKHYIGGSEDLFQVFQTDGIYCIQSSSFSGFWNLCKCTTFGGSDMHPSTFWKRPRNIALFRMPLAGYKLNIWNGVIEKVKKK